MACWRAFLFFEGGIPFFPRALLRLFFSPRPRPHVGRQSRFSCMIVRPAASRAGPGMLNTGISTGWSAPPPPPPWGRSSVRLSASPIRLQRVNWGLPPWRPLWRQPVPSACISAWAAAAFPRASPRLPTTISLVLPSFILLGLSICRYSSPIPAAVPCARIFPSSFRGAVMSQRFPRGGSPPSGPASPVQGRPASPLGRGCSFWSCTLAVQGNRRFCHDHEMGRRRGVVDDCPDCGRGKDSRCPCCLECRRDRDAVDVGVPPSRPFPPARSGPGAFRPALPASAAAAARAPGPSARPGSATSAAPAATSARTSPACSPPVSASAASPNADPGGRVDVPVAAPESRF